MRIDVKQIDINRGTRKNCYDCPITRAIRRHIGNYRGYIATSPSFIHIGGVAYKTPDLAVDFIDEYDHKKPVEPFSFELDIPA